MNYKQRPYSLFSACGLNCGLCPRYQMDGKSKCPGCAGKDFLTVHPVCGVLSCSQRRGLEYCFTCEEFPCKKYNDADLWDSFITHKNQFIDMEKAKISIDDYKAELNRKVEILENLLANYDDGRRKNFYCIAVNLLDLKDIMFVLKQMEDEIKPDDTKKQKAVIAVQHFQSIADNRNIELKLRKKQKS